MTQRDVRCKLAARCKKVERRNLALIFRNALEWSLRTTVIRSERASPPGRTEAALVDREATSASAASL